MTPSPTFRRRSLLIGSATWAGISLAAAPIAAAGGPPETIDLVDSGATAGTRSLFSYLRWSGSTRILFGHQEDLLLGSSFTTPDGTASDVLAATGDHPAVIGFDTPESVGMPLEERRQAALDLAGHIRDAHRVGAISTMSLHMENLATGGDFYDTTGDALRAALPGGEAHAQLVAHLDRIALTAQHAVDDDGAPIPIIFRPWHENAGSWFWWGAGFGTPGEYAELFRFTVEHLRDVRDVHNLLYAFSPGGGFGGDADTYLRTYPGDDFVDILGCDSYDGTGGSSAYLESVVADLAMMARVADERGKISAFTEFGINGGVRPDGENADLDWYTSLLAAITADPDAARTSYMLTWANYGGDAAPYTPISGEMLPDLQAFHDDPATLFADDLTDVYTRRTKAVTRRTAHLASPADGARTASGPVELRASVTGIPGGSARVAVTTDDGPAGQAEIVLERPRKGSLWWTGTWTPRSDEYTNTTRTLTLHVRDRGGSREVLTVESTVLLGEEPVLPLGVIDDFESYGDTAALTRTWVPQTALDLELVGPADEGGVGDGDGAMRLGYSFAAQSYAGAGRAIAGDWSGFTTIEAWIAPDGTGNTLVLQLVADGVAFECYPPMDGDAPYRASLPVGEWRPAPWDTANADRRLDDGALASVSRFSVFVNAVDGAPQTGSIAVDTLCATV